MFLVQILKVCRSTCSKNKSQNAITSAAAPGLIPSIRHWIRASLWLSQANSFQTKPTEAPRASHVPFNWNLGCWQAICSQSVVPAHLRPMFLRHKLLTLERCPSPGQATRRLKIISPGFLNALRTTCSFHCFSTFASNSKCLA